MVSMYTGAQGRLVRVLAFSYVCHVSLLDHGSGGMSCQLPVFYVALNKNNLISTICLLAMQPGCPGEGARAHRACPTCSPHRCGALGEPCLSATYRAKPKAVQLEQLQGCQMLVMASVRTLTAATLIIPVRIEGMLNKKSIRRVRCARRRASMRGCSELSLR